MSSSLIKEDAPLKSEPPQPKPVFGLAITALVVTVIGVAIVSFAAYLLADYNNNNLLSLVVGAIFVLGSLYPVLPTLKAFRDGGKRSSLLSEKKLVPARLASAAGREEAFIGTGYAAAAIIVGVALTAALTNKDSGIAFRYFTLSAWQKAFPEMIAGFWLNIWVSVVSIVLVLFFGLVLAVMRMLPGRAGAPLRLIATVYCDVFRAVPAIVVILLIVFGTPLAVPALKVPVVFLGILALTLTYSAYVAEVYRAGLSSIHPSQSAAARSLGLSYGQTLRKVLIPQAVRRVIPPLLNDFISLQKDTALLSVAAILDTVYVAQLWQTKLFNLSPITLAALFFILATLPQARFVDWLIDRDASRKAGG